MEIARPAIDQLRLAAGLVHVVPDAELHLFGAGGSRRVVSLWAERRPDPVPVAHPAHPGVASRASTPGRPSSGFELGGSLRSIAGTGVARRDADGAECWFATLLCPAAIEAALQECRVPVAPEHAAVAVRPDPLLGVSSVRLRIIEPSCEEHLAEIGMVAASACTIEEVLRDVRNGDGDETAHPDRRDIGEDGPPRGPTWPRWTGGA